MKQMRQATVKMSGTLYGRLQDAAEARGTTVAGAVRDLLQEHFDRAQQMSEITQTLAEIRSVQVLALAMLFSKSKDLDFAKDVAPELEKISRQWQQIVRAGDPEASHE